MKPLKSLLICQQPSDIPLLLRFIKDKNSADYEFFSMNDGTFRELQRLRQSFFSASDLDLRSHEAEKNRESERLAREWHTAIDWKNAAIEDGISLGEIVERDFALYLRSVFQVINLILGALLFKQPGQCVAVTSSHPFVPRLRLESTENIAGEVTRLLCGHLGISFAPVPAPLQIKRFSWNAVFFVKGLLGIFLNRFHPKPSQASVLFSGGLQQLGSVLEVFRQTHHKTRVSVLRDTWSFKYWRELKSKNVDFFVLPFTSEFRTVPRFFFKPPAGRFNEKNLPPPPGFFNYRGISCGKLVAPRMDYLFREYFPRLRDLIRQVNQFLKLRNVSLIVMDEDVCDFNKILAKAAASQNIPSLVIQHGAPCLSYGFAPLSATHMAVWGEISRTKFLNWGTPASRMTITGVPKYDRLIKKSALKNEATYRALKIDPSKKTIMVCPGISSVNPFERYVENVSSFEENFGMIEASLNAIAQLPGTQLIIKLHARDRDEVFIRKHVDNRRLFNVRVLKVFDSIALLGITDLLIASYSSVVLEAMLLDIPIVTTNFSGLPDLMPYSEEGGTLGVFQRGQLKGAMETLLYDEAAQKSFKEGRRRFLEKFICRTDGGSTKRVVELMDVLLSNAAVRESEQQVKEVFTFPEKVL